MSEQRGNKAYTRVSMNIPCHCFLRVWEFQQTFLCPTTLILIVLICCQTTVPNCWSKYISGQLFPCESYYIQLAHAIWSLSSCPPHQNLKITYTRDSETCQVCSTKARLQEIHSSKEVILSYMFSYNWLNFLSFGNTIYGVTCHPHGVRVKSSKSTSMIPVSEMPSLGSATPLQQVQLAGTWWHVEGPTRHHKPMTSLVKS